MLTHTHQHNYVLAVLRPSAHITMFLYRHSLFELITTPLFIIKQCSSSLLKTDTCLYFFRCYMFLWWLSFGWIRWVEAWTLFTRLDLINRPTESDSSGEHPDVYCRAFGFLIVGRGKPEVQGRQGGNGTKLRPSRSRWSPLNFLGTKRVI